MRLLIKKIILWFAAVLITLGASVYQRMTGPTYPKDITLRFDSEIYRFDLPRSHGGNTDCPVEIELPKEFTGKIIYRRYPTKDNWDTISMYRNNSTLLAYLPAQPPAGKLEYHLKLEKDGVPVALNLKQNIVVRFKGEVPVWALIPHVFFMFFAMLWSNATGLQAATGISAYKRNTLITVILLMIGGLILGPIVQKYAFGAFWTGWPFGEDLTDNKVLLSVIIWLVALFANRKKERKWLVIVAAVFLFAIYMIPHSMRGSELDYDSGNVITGLILLFTFKRMKIRK
ncbi:MAG: hypothetical protein K9J30_08580 [Bacteroidales bacterium]|nr:hypothetical protein [Bacteroidales bacterium]